MITEAGNEVSCIAKIILDKCQKTLSEKAMLDELMDYARNAARGGGIDLRMSAEIRRIIENNETEKVKYECLLRACRYRLLGEALALLCKNAEVGAQGNFAQAMGSAEFKPMFAVPANEFGESLYDEIAAMYILMGNAKATDFKKQFVEMPRQGGSPLITDV